MVAKSNLTGQTFCKLTVMYEAEKRGRLRLWHCKCECGKEVDVYQTHLVSGNSRSCGCVRHKLPKMPKVKPEPKPKCKYPSFSCKKSRSGVCCKECEENATCKSACLNTPEKCGYKKVKVVDGKLEEHN